jgi:hypothetical protein
MTGLGLIADIAALDIIEHRGICPDAVAASHELDIVNGYLTTGTREIGLIVKWFVLSLVTHSDLAGRDIVLLLAGMWYATVDSLRWRRGRHGALC